MISNEPGPIRRFLSEAGSPEKGRMQRGGRSGQSSASLQASVASLAEFGAAVFLLVPAIVMGVMTARQIRERNW
jgi:hypothetical protein